MKELTVKNLYGIRGEITHRTDANTLVIRGENGAGKSSFVNAFLHVFAHKAIKGAPDPIHDGQVEAEAKYTDDELGLSFSRHFKNGKMSSVEIRALDGAKYMDNPAAMLKARIGTVTVDVSEFLSADESKRRDLIISKATFPDGFDLVALSSEQARVESERTDANREKTRLEGALSQLTPPSTNTPDVELEADALYAQISAVQAANSRIADAARRAVMIQDDINGHEEEITRLEQEIRRHRAAQESLELEKSEALPASEPEDVQPLLDQLAGIEDTNKAVRAKANFVRVKAEYDAAAAKHASLDGKLKAVKAAKFDGLAKATFPHPALSVDDENVLLNGTPFIYANSAAKALAAVGVAIAGEHADDELRLVIIKDGDWLDATSLAAVDALLAERGFFGLVDRGRPDMPSATGIDVIDLNDGQVQS